MTVRKESFVAGENQELLHVIRDTAPADNRHSLEKCDPDSDMTDSYEPKKTPQYIVTAAVNLAALACGVALGWPSPATAKLKDINQTPLGTVVSTNQESWIGSLIALGAAVGPIPAGIAADRIGRKNTLLVASAPFIVAWFIISTTCNVTQIYVARFLMGISVGAIFTALPMYVGEIANDSIRGSLGSFMQLFITLGLLLAYAVGPYVSFFWFSVFCFIIPVLFAGIFVAFPESPYFLVEVKRRGEAAVSIKKLTGLTGDALDREVARVQENVEEAMRTRGSFKDILSNPGNRKALLLSLGLVAGQQLSGINVVLFYTQTIFETTGSDIPADLSAIAIGAVQVLSSGITPLVVERLGRRMLLLISAGGMCLSLVVLGAYFHLHVTGVDVKGISFLPILSLIVYMFVYCIGFGPIPWAAMGELFPPNIKSIASTATASFCWIIGFLMTKFFADIAGQIGMAGAFWIFSGFCVLAGVFVYTSLPETKGKSLHEIQEILNGVNSSK